MLTLDGAPDVPKDGSSEATRDRREELAVAAEADGAKEVKLSAATVAELREEHFGPIEDPRLTALRADAEALRTELVGELRDIVAMAEAHKTESERRLDAIERQLAGLP